MAIDVSDDLLDAVDENDKVIGTFTRAEIHRDLHRHRAVHLWVFNNHGDVFLQKRSMNKDNNPGLWDSSVSGHVDSGESYDHSVVREAQEEIGIVLTEVPQWIFTLPASKHTGWEFTAVYRCTHEGPFQLNADEIDDGDWYSMSKLSRLIEEQPQLFAESVCPIWRELNRWMNRPA